MFHGHWNQRNHDRLAGADVFGLAHDGRDGCMAILDLGELAGDYHPR
ncbi:MAG: hypothetical protein OXI26_07490 [bacterium]|nr:hypothetical protein [bacterium]